MPGKMNATLTWVDGMSFEGKPDSGHSIHLDASTEVGGKNRGARPLEMLLLGLGGCTGMDVISILQKMRQKVSSYEIKVSAERAEEHPKVFTNVLVEHVVTGPNLSEEAVNKAVHLSDTKYCSASAMLAKGVNIETVVRVIQESPVEAEVDN